MRISHGPRPLPALAELLHDVEPAREPPLTAGLHNPVLRAVAPQHS